MRKILIVTAIPVILFAHNTLWGTRGTFDVYSGRCEDPGLFLLNLNTWFYMGPDSTMKIDTSFAGTDSMRIDTSYIHGSAMRLKPIVSLSFTPWKYLEFGGFVMGTYYTFDSQSSPMEELYQYVGFVAKGGIPFGHPEEGFYFAPGVKGTAIMDLINTNNQRFGGTGIISLGYKFFDLHLNGGYEYLTAPSSADIIFGTSFEISPFKFLNLFVEVVDTTTQENIANFGTHKMAVVPGLRVGIRNNFFLFANLGTSIGIQNLPMWNAVGGISLGYDFITPRKLVISGRVIDATTRQPVADAKVYMEEHPEIATFTDEEGEFSLEVPGPGRIMVEHPNYSPATAEIEEGKVYQIGVKEKPGVIALEPAESQISGVISDIETGEPISAAVRFHSLYSDTVIPSVVSDPLTGYYKRNLPSGSYRITVSAKDYVEASKTIYIRKGETVTLDFKLKKKEIKKPPKKKPHFKNIYFGRGSSIPTPKSFEALQDAVRILKKNPKLKVVIEGHTDSVGKRSANYYLSLRRANWVKNYLISHGVSSNRLKVVGCGETKPIGDNRTITGRALNRRVEIKPL